MAFLMIPSKITLRHIETDHSHWCPTMSAPWSLPESLVWFHAVNSLEHVLRLGPNIDERFKARAGRIPIAIECDIHAVLAKTTILNERSPRFSRHAFGAVLRHDPVPLSVEYTLSAFLHDLHSELRVRIGNNCDLEVIKFDVKDPRAVEYLQDAIPLVVELFPSLPRFRIWFNADIVQGPVLPYETNQQQVTFDNMPFEELQRVLETFGVHEKVGLSLGWVTNSVQFTPYGSDDALRMLRVLQHIGHRPVPLITFPVRYSLVFPSAELPTDAAQEATASEALQMLLLSVRALGLAKKSFYTFWRGRSEVITPADAAHARSFFPDCTIDDN